MEPPGHGKRYIQRKALRNRNNPLLSRWAQAERAAASCKRDGRDWKRKSREGTSTYRLCLWKKRLDYGLTNPHNRWCSSVRRKIEGTTAGNVNTSRLKIDVSRIDGVKSKTTSWNMLKMFWKLPEIERAWFNAKCRIIFAVCISSSEKTMFGFLWNLNYVFEPKSKNDTKYILNNENKQTKENTSNTNLSKYEIFE